jgi:hypothetical protein
MPTIEQINAEISRREQQAQLNTAVTAEIERRREPTAAELAAEGVGSLEAAAIAAGRGMTTIGRAVGLAEPEQPAVTASFEELEKRRPIATTVGEIAGQTAPFLAPGLGVGAVASQPIRLALTTALGAAEGGLIARGEGADIEQQLTAAGISGGIAGIMELALPRVSRIGRQVLRRVLGREATQPILDAAGKPSAEFIDALAQEGRTFDDVIQEVSEELGDEFVEPEQVARQAFLEAQGLDPTRAQVSRNAADFQAQQEAAETSGRVREALERQEAVLTTRFDNAVLDTGGRASTPTSTVTDSLVGKATVLDQQVSDLYKRAREVAPGEKNVRFDTLTTRLRQLAPSDRRAGGNISAIVGDLQTKGILDDNMKIVGRVDVETAEDVRKLMNELYDAQNPFGNGLLRELKDTLDDDVFRAAGDDVFQEGRAAKAAFEQELTRAKISKFDSRKANLVRDVLENKIDPDRFVDQVVMSKKWRATDLQQLKDYISTDEAGQAAFNDLRAETLNEIKNRAFIGPVDADGFKALSRGKLERAINSVGKEKISVLFTPEENRFLRDMLKVAELREPVRGTAVGRGSSAQAIAKLENKLKGIPLMGALVQLINVDAQGRIALRASPERVLPPVTPSPTRTGAAQAAGAVGVSQLPQDQQE